MTRFRSFFILALILVACRASASTEGAVLDEINLARAEPHEYAGLLEARMRAIRGADSRCVAEAISFLRRQSPMDPLQSVTGLMMCARQHTADQGASGAVGHRGGDGGSPWSRMARWGQFVGRAGENISYGYSDARGIVATLIVDQGIANRGHRHNIFCRAYHVAGVACGPHAQYHSMCVMDFAGGFADKSLADKGVAMTDYWRQE